MTIEWSEEDRDAACDEGWDIFETGGSENGPWQIQKFDSPDEWEGRPEPYPFEDDTDAWVHVRNRAETGSALHLKALAFLREHNRQEFDAIMAWVGGVTPEDDGERRCTECGDSFNVEEAGDGDLCISCQDDES